MEIMIPPIYVVEIPGENILGETKQFNLPELRTQISGPAVIVIPVAIYA